MTKTSKVKETKEVSSISTFDLSDCVTTSSKIRKLSSAGYSRSDISKFLGKRYQHVRNVLTQPLKKV